MLQECNLETGYICGSMLAENVPRAKAPVITFWEVRSPSPLISLTSAAVLLLCQPAPFRSCLSVADSEEGCFPWHCECPAAG